ncbi:MAG TPA: DEAD/DEAH box helicase [Candidatus Eisenbacteria bacterium]|nr:DEAD/DEAH box helicase [Candidatus Eisenbacteria bacterium]
MPFANLGLPPAVVKGVRAAGYVEPTPIQSKAIPIILSGADVIGAAQTGTGKTAAFILPILSRLLGGPKRLRALVLTPTRELAAQVETNARDYARFTELRVGVVYGGVPIPPQEKMLSRHGIDLLVATPGRLLDLHGRAALRLDDISILVLDEADRMVDMGFAPDLRRILRLLPTNRQTMMFSATMPPDLNRVAKEALKDPARVDLAPPSRPAAGITQAVYPVPKHRKTDLLEAILRRTDVGSVIVFARTKHGADRLAKTLARRGLSVATLHGNRTQGQRERALGDLRRGRVQILVATDIASRGIDVDAITHVINYDVPHTPEDYVHRIGRTGRVDALGDAFTLMTPEEKKDVIAIERFLGTTILRVMMPDFDYDTKAPDAGLMGPSAYGPRGRGQGGGASASHGGGASQGGQGSRGGPDAAAGSSGRRPRKALPFERRPRRPR